MWWESQEVTPNIKMARLSHDLNNKCWCWLDLHDESVYEKAILQICWSGNRWEERIRRKNSVFCLEGAGRASSINPKKTNSRRCEAFLCCLSVGCCFMKHRSERHLLRRQICLLKIQSLSWENHKEWVICRRPLTGKSVCHWSRWTLQAGANLQMCFELSSPLHIYICKDFSLPSLPFTKA